MPVYLSLSLLGLAACLLVDDKPSRCYSHGRDLAKQSLALAGLTHISSWAQPSFLPLQDCAFSSRDQLLAVGLVSGGLRLYDCNQQHQPVKAAALKAHSGSCRAVCYDSSGTLVHTASANGSLLSVDVATKRRKVQQKAAHAVGVCRLCAAAPNLIASGKLSLQAFDCSCVHATECQFIC